MSDEGLTGEITHISQAYNQGWMWGRLLEEKTKKIVSIAGILTGAYKGMNATVLGEWTEHEKYGKQFKVEALIPNLPTARHGVEEWLIQHIPHIGPVRAQALVRTYGEKLWEVLEKDPWMLVNDITGITSERVREIILAYEAAKFDREERVRLYTLGFTQTESSRLLKEYGKGGTRVSDTAKADPHFFYVDGKAEISFARAESVFSATGNPPASPGRLKAAVVAAFRQAAEDGDTLLGAGDLFEKMNELIELHDGVAYRNALHHACSAGLVRSLGDDEYMESSLYKAEFHVAHAIEGLLGSKQDPVIEEVWAAIDEYTHTQEVINGKADAVAGSGGTDDAGE